MSIKGSMTVDINPEGINQYTGGGGSGKKSTGGRGKTAEKGMMNASSGASFHRGEEERHRTEAVAHGANGKQGLAEAHMRAATLHKGAAQMYERAQKHYEGGYLSPGMKATQGAEKYASQANHASEVLSSRSKR